MHARTASTFLNRSLHHNVDTVHDIHDVHVQRNVSSCTMYRSPPFKAHMHACIHFMGASVARRFGGPGDRRGRSWLSAGSRTYSTATPWSDSPSPRALRSFVRSVAWLPDWLAMFGCMHASAPPPLPPCDEPAITCRHIVHGDQHHRGLHYMSMLLPNIVRTSVRGGRRSGLRPVLLQQVHCGERF